MMDESALHLIVDLEATCSNDGLFPRSEMEIIEIGAVIWSSYCGKIESEFQTFVKPVRHPTLTSFCIELTSITQADVEQAPCLAEAIAAFREWLKSFDVQSFCSWGDYDFKQLKQDCEYHNIPFPLDIPHRNLKVQFSEHLGVSKRFGMAKALKRIGEPLDGVHHRGLDDARNIAKILKHMERGQ